MVVYGGGDLGRVEAPGYIYQLEWQDLLWLGRMLMGEPLPGAGELEWAGLCWCYAQRHARLNWGNTNYAGDPRDNDSTRRALQEARNRNGPINKWRAGVFFHSQPINPRWFSEGHFCTVGRGAGQDSCSPERTSGRRRRFALSWNEIDIAKRRFLVRWARAEVDNPIPGYVDFAGFQVGVSSQFSRPKQLTRAGRRGAGNWFYKIVSPESRKTTDWAPDRVKIVFEDNTSGVDEPEEPITTSGTSETRNINERRRSRERGEIIPRERRITSDRTSPPDNTYQYFTVSGSTEDSQASITLTQDEERDIVRTNNQRFVQQVQSLKRATTLDLAQTVPIIEISTEDENGELVPLNQLIFGKSPFHELLNEPNKGFTELPERPIASIVGLNFKVETPSVGGPAAVTVGTLQLKVHNPDKITEDHPRGKYIYYMLKQGLFLRIKYGTIGPQTSQTSSEEDMRRAFQWKESDFFVAQHDININLDKTYDLNITILPATEKLFNQINIGESLPFSEDGQNFQITDSDLTRALENVVAPDTTNEEINEVKEYLRPLQHVFNQGQPSPGYRLSQQENEQGETTFGSVLHGAISQSDILNRPEGQSSVAIENAIDAIRSLQSILLTRRIESMLERDAYMTELKGVNTAAVNMGPLISRLVLPEFKQVALYTAQNNLKTGETFSSDRPPERSDNQSPPRRSKVKLIFDTFNSDAGDWGDRPISEFPVNVNAILGHLRNVRDVGQFASTVNNFILRINQIINEPQNFVVERNSNSEEGIPPYPLERPQIKYLFYPDPTEEDSWILLFYDNKKPLVTFRKAIGYLEKESSIGNINKDQLIQHLNELGIPYLEMGESGTIIKNMTARTKADDLTMTHNMIVANQQAITRREADGSTTIPQGFSQEWAAGRQRNNQQIIKSTTLVLPVEINMTTYMMVSAYLFTPLYVFFPTKMFSSLYLPYVIDHEVRDGFAQTRMTLQINITSANRGA